MKPLPVNTDIGERGIGHPVDLALMDLVSMANIACGGHAGDASSAAFFRRLAEERNVTVTAHLSYPDRAGFGRQTLSLPFANLASSLDAQLDLLPGIRAVKFHGALYNDAAADAALAGNLAAWLVRRRVRQVVTLPGRELDLACRRMGMTMTPEAFAERRYAWSPATRRLSLLSRSHPLACITDCREALEQAARIRNESRVRALIQDGAALPAFDFFELRAETICIHSDSSIALELARGLGAAEGNR